MVVGLGTTDFVSDGEFYGQGSFATKNFDIKVKATTKMISDQKRQLISSMSKDLKMEFTFGLPKVPTILTDAFEIFRTENQQGFYQIKARTNF